MWIIRYIVESKLVISDYHQMILTLRGSLSFGFGEGNVIFLLFYEIKLYNKSLHGIKSFEKERSKEIRKRIE